MVIEVPVTEAAPAVITKGDHAARRARGRQAQEAGREQLRKLPPVAGCPVYRDRCGYPDPGRSHRPPGSSPPSDTFEKPTLSRRYLCFHEFSPWVVGQPES